MPVKSAFYVCCKNSYAGQNISTMEANTLNPDQTDPIWVHIVSNIGYRVVYKQIMRKQIAIIVNGSKGLMPSSVEPG